jgi:hypothetical protein
MMSATSRAAEVDLPAWVREHEACWELAPVHEMVKGRGVQQTGYALKLFGRFDPAAQDDDEAIARGIYERLGSVATEVMRFVPAHSLVQVQPFGRAVIPNERRLAVEVELTVVASPAHPEHPLPSGEVRRLIAMLEERLRSIGLKKRS